MYVQMAGLVCSVKTTLTSALPCGHARMRLCASMSRGRTSVCVLHTGQGLTVTWIFGNVRVSRVEMVRCVSRDQDSLISALVCQIRMQPLMWAGGGGGGRGRARPSSGRGAWGEGG